MFSYPSPPITRTVTQVFPVKIVPEYLLFNCSWDVNMGQTRKGMLHAPRTVT